MVDRRTSDPSPFRSGVLHGFLSVAVFGGLAAMMGGLIHVTGDPAEAGPQTVVSLFETEPSDPPNLRTRASGEPRLAAVEVSASEPTEAPSLGVADPGAGQSSGRAAEPASAPRGIRINGKLVQPGQRYSQVERAGEAPVEQTVQTAATPEQTRSESLVQPNEFARPFDNPQGKPIVSLVIGGLGTSYRQAISAIDELPPEVTLSFVPTARPDLLRYARRKGHEVLLEIPMEPLERGRARSHRDMLLAGVPGEDNVLRLNALLRSRYQLYGVITYQGDKFIASEGAIVPILNRLKEKNLAFFQHSVLSKTDLTEDVSGLGLMFASAQENIDTEIRASEIEAQLFKLETQALDEGVAFGTGFSYPLTVDLVARWSKKLGEKGILLAPASAVAAKNAKAQSAPGNKLALVSVSGDTAQ